MKYVRSISLVRDEPPQKADLFLEIDPKPSRVDIFHETKINERELWLTTEQQLQFSQLQINR